MSNKGVCRSTPATLGLLKIYRYEPGGGFKEKGNSQEEGENNGEGEKTTPERTLQDPGRKKLEVNLIVLDNLVRWTVSGCAISIQRFVLEYMKECLYARDWTRLTIET